MTTLLSARTDVLLIICGKIARKIEGLRKD